ncbi:MAG TPA: hypothetical protein VER96_17350 [Polyangiaceae bacterium]|nr:hypothetical protein [Polyangiaceae bacterium]
MSGVPRAPAQTAHQGGKSGVILSQARRLRLQEHHRFLGVGDGLNERRRLLLQEARAVQGDVNQRITELTRLVERW